jgi:hypothetical protein
MYVKPCREHIQYKMWERGGGGTRVGDHRYANDDQLCGVRPIKLFTLTVGNYLPMYKRMTAVVVKEVMDWRTLFWKAKIKGEHNRSKILSWLIQESVMIGPGVCHDWSMTFSWLVQEFVMYELRVSQLRTGDDQENVLLSFALKPFHPCMQWPENLCNASTGLLNAFLYGYWGIPLVTLFRASDRWLIFQQSGTYTVIVVWDFFFVRQLIQ